jgi:hypothetical protein
MRCPFDAFTSRPQQLTKPSTNHAISVKARRVHTHNPIKIATYTTDLKFPEKIACQAAKAPN